MYAYFKQGREPLSSYTHFWGAAAGVLGISRRTAYRAHKRGLVIVGILLERKGRNDPFRE